MKNFKSIFQRFRLTHILLCASAALAWIGATATAQDFSAGQQYFFEGHYKKAIAFFEKKSNSAESTVWLSNTYEQLGDYVKAQNAILQFSDWQNSAPLVNRMGELSLALARYPQAKSYFEKAFALDSTFLEARLNLGIFLAEWGQTQKAHRLLQYFVDLYKETPSPDARLNDLTARACIYLSRFQDANDLFQDAVRLRPEDWRIQVRWGSLFLQKYNYAEALRTFSDVLKQNPNAVSATIGLAAANELSRPEVSLALVEKLLDEHSNRLDVLNYAARLYLAMGDFIRAKDLIQKALQKAPDHLESLTLKGSLALYQKQFDQFEQVAQMVLQINPAYSRFYTQAGEALAKRYLFKEAVGMFQKALALNPQDAEAHAGLGTTLSRLAKLGPAKAELEKAFKLDPYNVWTGNLLSLFDSYVDYDTLRTAHFVIRLHKQDRPILGPYAAALAERAYAAMVPRYKVKLDLPVHIEIFPKHDDFAVRCFGLPGSQVFLGICFGPLVTMNSPRARPLGTFNWSETLWHEFAHVVHLTLTQNRVPRWLAEGISVYETTRANPAWAMNMQPAIIRAIQENDLIPLAKLDRGFTGDPRRVTFSYYQASLMVQFIVQRYGFKTLLQLLDAFKHNQETPQAIKSTLGLNLKDFDKEFLRYLKKSFPYQQIDFGKKLAELVEDKKPSRVLLKKVLDENPKLYFVQLRYAKSLIDDNLFEKAIPILEQALERFPEFVGPDNPYKLLALSYLSIGDTSKAMQRLLQLIRRDGKNYQAAIQLAGLAKNAGRPDLEQEALVTANQVYPYNLEIHRRLGEIFLQKHQAEEAVREFKVLLALNPMDKASAHCSLAEALLLAHKKKEANRHVLKALEIAPTYPRAQAILLKTVQ